MFDLDFSRIIKDICEIEKISLREFSDKYGFKYSTCRNWASGQNKPSAQIMLKLTGLGFKYKLDYVIDAFVDFTQNV